MHVLSLFYECRTQLIFKQQLMRKAKMSLKLSDMRAIDGHIVCDIDEHDIPFVLMSAYFVFNICYKKVVIICASFFELSLLNIKTKLPPFSEAILSEFRKLHDPTDNVDIIIIDRLLLSPSMYAGYCCHRPCTGYCCHRCTQILCLV